VMGHYYRGPDGFVYRMVGWRRGDGLWTEELFGRSPTRTISTRAIDRTFHHHRRCPGDGCRGARRLRGMHSVEYSGCQQVTDGTTLWINDSSGMCIGRLSPQGIDIHATFDKQMQGEHCLLCEPAGSAPLVTFAAYVKFCENMERIHGVTVSSALDLRLVSPPPVADVT
jgi:hypothetical protein